MKNESASQENSEFINSFTVLNSAWKYRHVPHVGEPDKSIDLEKRRFLKTLGIKPFKTVIFQPRKHPENIWKLTEVRSVLQNRTIRSDHENINAQFLLYYVSNKVLPHFLKYLLNYLNI